MTSIRIGVLRFRLPCGLMKRSFSNTHASSSTFRVYKCDVQGHVSVVSKTLADFVKLRNDINLPVRDMRIFFQPQSVQERRPVILVRPSSHCFLFNLEHIKLICQKNECIIWNPEDPSVLSFVDDLQKNLQRLDTVDGDITPYEPVSAKTAMHSFLEAFTDKSEVKLELSVLEVALASVSGKYQRHLHILKPVLDVLLRETSQNPSTDMLRRVLAFKKTLNAFEMNVTTVRNAVSEILRENNDIIGLCLSTDKTNKSAIEVAAEDIELLLETYNSDLKEIECELQQIQEQIDDTNDFIKIHLNTIRNKMLRMSLYMEMGTMSLGFGALCAGLFGMNLTNGFEQHSTAFMITCGTVTAMVTTIFAIASIRFSVLSRDYSSAQHYQTMKHFFDYVKKIDKELHVDEDGSLNIWEFRKILEPVVGNHLTEEDVVKIFNVLDGNKDGSIDREELTLRSDREKQNNKH